MKAEDRVGKVEDLLCASCDRTTEHTIIASYTTHWDYQDAISGGARHDFLRCNGCKSGTYRTRSWCSEEDGTAVVLHPPRGGHTRQPKSFRHVPDASLLEDVYKQTITTFNSGCFTLAGAGVRLLIEGICKEQGVDEGPIFGKTTGLPVISKKNGKPVISDSLEGKINGMAERDIISKKQLKHLHEIRDLGNDSAHEPYIPDMEVVNHAIDIVEHIFDQIYEQPHKAKMVAGRDRP